MKAVVLYESMYGNTELVAKAVASGLKAAGEVTVGRFGEVPDEAVSDADLIVVGGPTHQYGMSRPASRGTATQGGYSVGAREWLESTHVAGKKAAAFDTRMTGPRWVRGSAARRIGKELRRHGFQLVAEPEDFLVRGADGPLQEGEEERARTWGAQLAGGGPAQ